jgi:ankyrin repeat protein
MITAEERRTEQVRCAARRRRAAEVSEDVEARDVASGRALLDAVDRGDEDHTKALLQGGVDVKYVGIRGASVLHLCAVPSLTKSLLAAGAESSTKTSSKQSGEGYGAAPLSMGANTPLHYSSFSGHDAVVRTLLESKANVRAKNDNGDAPVDVAKHAMHQKIVRMLANPDEAIAKARKEARDKVRGEEHARALAASDETTTRRKKEIVHRRSVEDDELRKAQASAKAAEEVRDKSRVLLDANEAGKLAPLKHYPS